jgi:hypothetical protein
MFSTSAKPLPKFREMYGIIQRFVDGRIHNDMIALLWKNNNF